MFNRKKRKELREKKLMEEKEKFEKSLMDTLKTLQELRKNQPPLGLMGTLPPPPPEFIKKIIDRIDASMRDRMDGGNSQEHSNFCDCSHCLSFKTFEKMLNLHPNPGTFDYHSMTLNGKTFNVKYWDNLKNGGSASYMMVREIKNYDNRTKSELEEDLEDAINTENYEEAKRLRDALDKVKQTSNK